MFHTSKIYWENCFTQIINFNHVYISSFLIFMCYVYTLCTYIHVSIQVHTCYFILVDIRRQPRVSVFTFHMDWNRVSWCFSPLHIPNQEAFEFLGTQLPLPLFPYRTVGITDAHTILYDFTWIMEIWTQVFTLTW